VECVERRCREDLHGYNPQLNIYIRVRFPEEEDDRWGYQRKHNPAQHGEWCKNEDLKQARRRNHSPDCYSE
jgi:hypothetical protein